MIKYRARYVALLVYRKVDDNDITLEKLRSVRNAKYGIFKIFATKISIPLVFS